MGLNCELVKGYKVSEVNTGGKSQKDLEHWAKYAPLPIDVDFDSQFITNARKRWTQTSRPVPESRVETINTQ